MLKRICGMLSIFIIFSFSVNASDSITNENYEKFDILIQDINEQVKYIDNKLDSIRETDEFLKYPAIRLNIDTPMFGLVSIIDSKLKISSNVNAYDMALGYGVKSIIKDRIIKVPTFDVAGIVVITRDIKIEESMSQDDANVAIVELMKVYNKIIDVKDFFDKQCSDIFNSYYLPDKENSINNINFKLKNIDSNLDEMSNLISCFEILGVNKDKELYYTNLEKYNEFKKYTTDIFSSNEELEKIIIDIDLLNENLITNLESMNKEYIEIYESISYKECLNNLYTIINLRIENIGKYDDIIDNKKYTFSKDLNYFEKKEVNIYEELDELSDQVKIYDITDGYDISNLTDMYLDFLVRENKYYINCLSYNVKDINKSNILTVNNYEYIKFINIDMIEKIDQIYLNYEKNNILSNIKSINNLKEILDYIVEMQKYIEDVKEIDIYKGE